MSLALYGLAAAVTFLVGRAYKPQDVLKNAHHLRIYWSGAIVTLCLVLVCADILLL